VDQEFQGLGLVLLGGGRIPQHRDHPLDLFDGALIVTARVHQIDPDVRKVAERLWPWAWHYIGTRLADYARAAEIVELVAYRSRHRPDPNQTEDD